MFQNRISGFDMGLGDHQDSTDRQPLPATVSNGLPTVQPRPLMVTMADVFQAAINQAVQDYELNKLFNPDYYDYQI